MGPWVLKIWGPLSVTRNLDDASPCFYFLLQLKCRLACLLHRRPWAVVLFAFRIPNPRRIGSLISFFFFFVGWILLQYLYVYFPNIPAIATDNLYFFILFCLFTTCFGPYGPSSGETHHLYIYENYHTTAYPLFLQLFTYIVYVSLSIYNLIMVIVSIKWIQYI
jgi:hypothetical protein